MGVLLSEAGVLVCVLLMSYQESLAVGLGPVAGLGRQGLEVELVARDWVHHRAALKHTPTVSTQSTWPCHDRH